MEKIGLLIDSTTLTRDDLEAYNFIKVAELKVEFDKKTYNESQLSRQEMEKNVEAGKRFLTSQPSPAEFLDLFKEYFKEGYTHVITICISHRLSGTYQSALIAKSMIDFNLEVEVHSPLAASFGVALIAKEIADMIASNKSFSEITSRYHNLTKETLVTFTLGDLMNLYYGGRLNKVQAFIGKILRIKPIIEMIDGKLELVKKERTNAACIEFFINKIDYYVKKYSKVYLDIININMSDSKEKLLEIVNNKYKSLKIHHTDYLSPVFYSHLGNKGFGVAIIAE